jgi:tetratricopeptide (TPR) repeat protein
MNDLFDWADEITDKDREIASNASGVPLTKYAEPESDEEEETKENEGAHGANQLRPRTTVAPRSHRDWDKFKVDDEINKLEEKDRAEEERARRKKVAEKRKAKQKAEAEKDEKKRTAEMLKEQGNEHVKASQFQEALDCYTQSLALNASNAVALSNRAHVYLMLDEPALAERDCTAAIDVNRKYIKAYYRRAMANLKLEKAELAELDLKKVISLDPQNAQAREKLALLQGSEVPDWVKEKNRQQRDAQSKPKEVQKPMKPMRRIFVREVCSRPAAAAAAAEEEIEVEAAATEIHGESRSELDALLARKVELRPATTWYQFERTWSSTKAHVQRVEFLKMMPTASLGSVFKEFLDDTILGGIINLFESHLAHQEAAEIDGEVQWVVEWLEAIAKVPRFATVCMCLEPADVESFGRVRDSIAAAVRDQKTGVAAERIDALAKLYS